MKEQQTHYGQLVQAAYDNLGLDECARAQYGNAVQPPDQLLAYTQGNYSVAEGHKGPVQSTYDRYAGSPVLPGMLQLGPVPMGQ